jgi:hypothetical protein
MANKKIGDTNVIGRMHDAFKYALRNKDGTVECLADFDGPEAVTARWLSARKSDGEVTFSGGHAAPGAPLDLWGTKLASEIAGITAYSTASIGLTEELAKRLVDVEQGLAQVIEAEGETGDKVDALVEELLEKKLLNPEDWEGDEDEEAEGGQPGAAQQGLRVLSSAPIAPEAVQGQSAPAPSQPDAIPADFVGADEEFA